MSQRIIAALAIAWISSACGDGGTRTQPSSPVADPPANPQDPPLNPQDPPANPQDPPLNPQDPPLNPNQPPTSSTASGGTASIDTSGQAGRGNPGPGAPGPGPGNRCTQANNCACAADCDTCKCFLGNDSTVCSAVCP